MARPRTPTKLLDARGSFKKDPQRKRDAEPEVKEPIGQPPSHLAEDELSVWRQIVTEAPMGVLTAADTMAVESASILMAEFRREKEKFAAGKLGRLQAFLGQFGMTPADRAKLSIEKPRDENPFGSL